MRRSLLLLLLLPLAAAVVVLALQIGGPREPVPAGERPIVDAALEAPVVAAEPAAPGTGTAVTAPSQSSEEGARREIRPAAAETEERIALRGRVLEKRSGAPLAGVTVIAKNASVPPEFLEDWVGEVHFSVRRGRPAPLQGKAVTDERGAFALREDALPESDVRLTIESDTHYLPSLYEVDLEDPGELVLEAERGGRIAGTLRGPDGLPRAGAKIVARPPIDVLGFMRDEGRGWGRRTVETDTEGAFSVGALPPGVSYTVSATGDGFAPAEKTGVRVREGEETRIEILAATGGTVRGVVREESGDPIGGATVSSHPSDFTAFVFHGGGPQRANEAASDGEGRFVLPNLAPGRQSVIASASGFFPVADQGVEIEVREGETAGPVELVLRRGVSIEGTVVDAEGNPVVGAHVTASGENMSARGFRFAFAAANLFFSSQGATTAEGGRFRLEGIAGEGPFTVIAENPPTGRGIVEDVKAGASDVRIALEPTGGIAGIVIDSERDEPVVEFEVTAAPLDESSPRTPTRVEGAAVRFELHGGAEGLFSHRFEDPKGKFLFEGLPAGVYTLTVDAEGYVAEPKSGIEVARGEVTRGIIVSLSPAASIAGRVLDPDGTPVRGVKVHARPEGDRNRFDFPFFGGPGPESSRDGSFVLGDLEGATYDLVARIEGFARGEAKGIEIGTGERLEGVEIRLRRGGSFYGRVTDRHGKTLEGRDVVAFSMGAGSMGNGRSGADGHYEILGLESGAYMVSLQQEGGGAGIPFLGGMQMQTAQAREGERTRLDLVDEAAAGCRVYGVVRRAGRPVASAAVLATKEGSGLLPGLPGSIQGAQADGNGRYEFPSLAPGEYDFRVSSGGPFSGGQTEIAVEVPDRVELLLDLELPETSVSGRVVEAANGRAVEGAFVRLVPSGEAEGAPAFAFGVGSVATTEADGTFRLEGVSPGSYTLLARGAFGGEAHAPARLEDIRVEADRPVADLLVRLEAGGTIRLAVTGPAGEELGTVFAELEVEGKPLGDESSFGMLEERTIEFGGVPPGEVDVLVHSLRHGATRVEGIPVRAGEVTERAVALERGTALSAVLLDGKGERVEDAAFDVRDASGRRRSMNPQWMAVTRRMGGVFGLGERDTDPDIVGCFAPGRYRVAALRGGKEVASATVALGGEASRSVTLRER